MSSALLRFAAIGFAAVLAHGCVAVEAGPPPYGVDYYEPAGVVYGGWGVGYDVGPYRHDYRGDHPEVRAGGPVQHAFRPAPAGRSIPSIPTGPRGGAPGGGGRR